MNLIWTWLKENPIRTMFLIPILLVTVISISHVVAWYSLSNPISWAIYLSIAIEVAAMTALVAATNRIKGGVWIMFGLVTLVQMIGNIFFSYKEIDSNSDFFVKYDELDLENKKVIDEVVEKKNEFEELESIDEEPVTYGEESVNSIESIETEVLESEDSVEEIVENEVQDVPDTNVVEITENVEPISESQQRMIDNANLSNLEYIRKMVGIPDPIVQTPEPEIEKEIVIEEETNDGEISDNKVRLAYTKNS